ncbi:MAG: glycosyltransferase family 2 protein, partial [Promethearchaeia archaeon]
MVLEAQKQKIYLEITPDLHSKEDLLISIIIPLYNEEKTITQVINSIPNHRHYEIIIVDDGSTDKSLEKIQELSNDNNYINIISHKENKGYGSSILTGFKHSTGDIIVTLDSDGQHDPGQIPLLIKPILDDEADIVIGSRYLGKSNYKIPLHTQIGEAFVEKILKYLFHREVENNQSGFRAFRKECIDTFDEYLYTDFGLCTEILFKASM